MAQRRGWVVLNGIVAAVVWAWFVHWPHYTDASGHFLAGITDPYAVHLKTQSGAYIYSPAFTQALEPFRWVGVDAYYALVVAGMLAVLVYCAGPWFLWVLPFAWGELTYGNINLPLLACVLVGFRYPAAWAAILLTKVTPGVGLLWFAFRREWRQLRIALWATIAVTAASLAFAPHLWGQWAHVLVDNANTPQPAAYISIPLWLRLGASIALLAWAAPRGHRWAVPVTFVLATPWLHPNHLLMLVGVTPLLRPHGGLPVNVPRPAVVRACHADHLLAIRKAGSLAPVRRAPHRAPHDIAAEADDAHSVDLHQHHHQIPPMVSRYCTSDAAVSDPL